MRTWVVKNQWDTVLWEGKAVTAGCAIREMMEVCKYPNSQRDVLHELDKGIYAYPKTGD